MTSEEPGMSVSAPATRPPVQDSAVAMVSFRIRQRSSSERARPRASLPVMSKAPAFGVVPRKPDRGARGRRYAFLAAGEAEPFTSGCLHRNTRDVDAGNLRDACAHGVAQGSDLRPLTDQGHLEIGDP